MSTLPLFDLQSLKAIRAEREALLKRLRRGGVDALTRMKREDRLRHLTARQIEAEARLGLIGKGGPRV